MKTYNAMLFGREVHICRMMEAPIEIVWDYMTRAELLARWFARGEIGAVGSRIRMAQTTDLAPWKKKGYTCGVVIENDRPYRLTYTLKEVTDELPEDEVEDSIVRITLCEVGGYVRLDIVHSRLGREELPWVHAQWSARFDLLQDDLATHGGDSFRLRADHCLID